MPISLGFEEWGCPKRGDAHITVTLDQRKRKDAILQNQLQIPKIQEKRERINISY